MTKKDKISKLVWNNLNACKDTTTYNLMQAFQQKQLKVDQATLTLMIQIVNLSIDEGFEKGHKTFLRALEKTLEEA